MTKDCEIKSNMIKHPLWYDVSLSNEHLDYLWKICNEAKIKKKDYKQSLIGNISSSYELIDEGNYFWNSVLCKLSTLASEYFEPDSSNKFIDYSDYGLENSNNIAYLKDWWVNYQYKHEFNPLHNHSGLYSFVIWLKIPYSAKERSNLDFLKGLKEKDKKAGVFEMQYCNSLGNTVNYVYPLSKEWEGKMIFFPSKLHHCAHPFYNTDEEKVSISGNIWLKPVKPSDIVPRETDNNMVSEYTVPKKINKKMEWKSLSDLGIEV